MERVGLKEKTKMSRFNWKKGGILLNLFSITKARRAIMNLKPFWLEIYLSKIKFLNFHDILDT